MRSTPSVSGRVVLITGAARGLGAALAQELSGRGARVALAGLEPDELAVQAAACGPDAGWWQADVTDEAGMVEVAGQVRERFGRIDAVVANAGILTGGTTRNADPRSFDRVIEVNLIGQARTARAVLPHLIDSRGYYLQIASAAAIFPSPVLAAYCASKSGVEAFAHALSGEVRHLGVTVGIADLAWIDTDLVRGTDSHPATQVARAAMPWPLSKTYPVQPAVRALADAVAARKRHVIHPSWLWAAYFGRGLVPDLTAVIGNRFARRSEAAAARHPHDVVTQVGAGGAADRQVRDADS
jgi:NAD(P)-dependent dehydrogenase (short-subunit alcohol dehydrogenase family)